MSFKKTKLATCIALATMVPATFFAANASDNINKFSASAEQTQGTSYFVYLSDVGALTKATVNNKNKLKAALAQTQTAQAALLTEIMAVDASVQQLASAKLFGNFIRIKANAESLDKIRALPGVQAVVAETAPVALPSATKAEVSSTVAGGATQANEPALSENAMAGEGVKVAIIGSGVDYTHVGLGGDGTAESYATAMENAINVFDGFPTDVVVEGMDLSSDAGWGVDPNPIDQNVYYTRDYDGATHNTGHGTRLASVVHRLAPGAKIAAYKTSNVSDPNGWGYSLAAEDSSKFMLALEYALDPNQDGSFEDRADIIVVDALGGNAFYAASDDGVSSAVVEAHAIEMASAMGALLVVNAGNGGDWYDNKFNMTWRGAAPSALTVGGMMEDESGSMMVTERTPHGPVRGSGNYSKPDMVSYADGIEVAVVGGGDETGMESDTVMAAARVAAAAAVLKSERPELSMSEVKALLMNTANNAVMDLASKQGELTLIGNGVENLDNALASAIVAWEKNTYQPNLSFGFVEGMGTQRFVKEVQVKNLSDETVTYAVGLNMLDKAGNSALSWEYPASVSVPAGQTVVFPVVLEIDFSNLENWPMMQATDFTADVWASIELSGQLQLSADEMPPIKMSWLVKPRAGTDITRDFSTFQEHFGDEVATLFSEMSGGFSQQFSNTSDTDTTLATYPVMYHRNSRPDGKENTRGNLLNMIGGGIYDDAMCTSGKKLVIAGRFFDPNEVGIANHFDKGGAGLIWFSAYQEQHVLDMGWHESLDSEPFAWDEATQVLMSGFIEVDENGQPYAWFADLNQEYDWTQPRKRYTKSSLPTYISGHGQNFVAQYCTDELYHGEVTDLDSFDQNHGWIFATDRDAMAEIYEPIIQFNPVKYGPVAVTEYFDWFSGEMREQETLAGGLPVMAQLVEEGESKTYSPMITLAPGETAEFALSNECAFVFGFGATGCANHGMMLISLNDNFGMWSPQHGFSIARPKDGQRHSVDEDAMAGDLVATVELDSDSFFASADYESSWGPYSLSLANAIPGDPFTVTSEGDILVNNPAALDFDAGNTEYTLEVIGNQGNQYTAIANVVVTINDVNDIAPEVVGEMPAVNMAETGQVNIDASAYFIDAEGDVLTYSATGLPAGISIDSASGVISGKADAGTAGDYTVTVTADDMVNQTSAAFEMTVNPANNTGTPVVVPDTSGGGSSGSVGFGLLSLAALLGLRRRNMH